MAFESAERYYKKLKAANLIYKEKMTQVAAAEILGISRPTLAKMLDEAIDEGIVRFEVVDIRNEGHLLNLEIELKKKYGLLDAVIVDYDGDDNSDELLQLLGKASAGYFENLLHNNLKVGVSWGKTIERFASCLLENRRLQNLEVVSLIGGSLYLDSRYHSNTIVQRIADKYNGSGYFLYAPTYAATSEQLELYTSNPQIQEVLNLAGQVDIAVVGIGASIYCYTELYNQLNIIPYTQEPILDCGLNAQFLDMDGHLLGNTSSVSALNYSPDVLQSLAEANQLVIGLKLDDLKRINRVIGVAGGQQKHKAIRSVLLGNYINTLITDKLTAQYLISCN